jgi:hypothetical protein
MSIDDADILHVKKWLVVGHRNISIVDMVLSGVKLKIQRLQR